MGQTELPEITIVIPTYKRTDCLIRLLDSLNHQTANKAVFEIIVVDNAPQESINEVKILCDSPAYSELNLRYIYHSEAGVSAARNRGVAAARGELIGFLDDDTLPPPDWTEQVVKIFSETKADILGGPTKPYYHVDKPAWFRDMYAVTTQGENACWLIGNKTVSGANMAWRKHVIKELGGFLIVYGYLGKRKIYGEETELNLRAHRAGFRTWYDPRLLIQHCAHSDRMRVSWFFSLGYRYGQSKARLFFREWHAQDSRSVPRQVLSQFKSVIVNFTNLLGSLMVLPFRPRKKYQFWQNYAIEFIQPRIERFSVSVKLLELYFSNEAKP
jgi:GT2 family glycosyltransferase